MDRYGGTLLSGSEIGEHCVVGANALVTSSIPAYSVCVGSPAKCIRSNIDWER